MDSVIGFVILIGACLGNAEWWVILVNRRYSLRFRHAQLKQIRLLHDCGIVAFPVFIFIAAGIQSRGLLVGGRFSDLTPALQGIIGVSMSGLLFLFYSAVRWNFRSHPSHLISSKSRIHDCSGLPDAAGTKSSVLSRIPGNQILQLEVNQKQIAMMSGGHTSSESSSRSLRIAHFSDIHLVGCPGRSFFEFVTDQLSQMKPDLFVFSGDLLDHQPLLAEAQVMFERLRRVAPGFFVLGNHDWLLGPEEIREGLVATGWVSVAETTCREQIGDRALVITGSEAPWIGDNPVVTPRDTEDLRLFVSHTPDQRNWAVENQMDLMLSGHNHGGQVVLPLIGPVYSPSCYGVRYAGGTFVHKDLVIHVSRGVGAKDPLRWNCRPEISCLELNFDATTG